MARVTVRGEAEVRCLPDRAVLRVAVEGEGSSQEEAYTRASRSASSVDAVLDRFADAVDRRLATGVVVRPKTRWRRGESVTTGWLATRTTVVEVTHLDRLGALVAELPAADASAITGPSWQVDRSNPAYDEARRAAAQDAQRRAASYAESLGMRLGALLWIAEPGLRGRSPAPYAVAGPHLSRAAAPMGVRAEEPMDLGPEEVTITAVVEARFDLRDENHRAAPSAST